MLEFIEQVFNIFINIIRQGIKWKYYQLMQLYIIKKKLI